jgi:hypothetical protein
VRVSNVDDIDAGLAFTHVSAFHAETGVNLVANKPVTASAAFREPELATDSYYVEWRLNALLLLISPQ